MPEPEDVDEYISAELPDEDEDEDPELFQMVSELMIQGPCGENNPKCPCTDVKKSALSDFSKPYADVKSVEKDGYPVYKRTENGRKINKQGHNIDNGYVVPYNPWLVKKYQAHINVEWCNQVGAIKYVSSCEAVWRILSFDIHHRNPTVIRLSFHLHNQHSIVFDQYDLIENVLDKLLVKTSQFLELMKCNQISEEARKLTYVEFPTKSVRGPTSYQDIRTVNGNIYPTLKDACYALGLLDDDQEYIDGIKEANAWGSEIQLPRETLENLTFNEIEKILHHNGKSLKNFRPMPYPSTSCLNLLENSLIVDELSNNMKFFLWKTLSAALSSKGEIVLNVASSGIAALLLSGGRTPIHVL
ncbi:uncharacterized protein [Rutidosis leptorrhynchoides]|uniref:uncharacterized protein n=1 Tax=Rutidosis leptorrhynchoides TaxID=125765 RepID=UPI003A990D4B